MSDWKSEQTIRVHATADPFRPYPHQTAAWDAMNRHFATKSEGMLVIPTGGGKTAVAARWLLANKVKQGCRVLWFAHRRSLLRQAASTFDRAASLAQKDTLSRIVLSSEDGKWSGVAPSHDIVFSSVQSAALPNNFGFLAQMKAQSPKGLVIVVDEAHHAAAPSYRKVLSHLLELGCPLLGLSATPIRMDQADDKRLWNLFKHIIYTVDKRELINQGILSHPHIETIETKCEFEREFTEEDTQHLDRFGELGQRVLQTIASHSGRNAQIVEHYKRNRLKYDKTIVFAVDTFHAKTLAAEFAAQEIPADYVDYMRSDNDDVTNAYSRTDSPMVITNVEMLTEGVDLPRTKTVFIVRPTRSEALLTQMIGRALRGPAAGGTAEAHLVTFVDTWKNFSPLDAEYVVNTGEVVDVDPERRLPYELEMVAPELIMEAYKLVRSNVRGSFEGMYECLPECWYTWEAEYAEDIQRRHVLVFSNQVDGFSALLSHYGAPASIPAEISEDRARSMIRTFWGDCQDPLPSWIDVRELLEAKRDGVEVKHYTFREKDAFNPRKIAEDFWTKDLGERSKLAELEKIFAEDAVCRYVYRNDVAAFREDVQRELDQKAGLPEPPPPEVIHAIPAQLRAWPVGSAGHDLTALYRDVTEVPQHFPKGIPKVSDLVYMARPSKTNFGFFRYSDAKIQIHPELNSPDVPRFVMEFLVYHEVLHADMPSSGHDRNFRERERRFQPSEMAAAEAREHGLTPSETPDGWRCLADQFLDTLHLPSMHRQKAKM